MKKAILFSMVCLGLSVFISSCAKKEGCTDASALNYDSSAEKDNGTCSYKGSATFWNDAASSLGEVTVTMADGTTGTITSDYASAPSCGAAATFTYLAKPGTYSYTADETTVGSGTWSGTVTITSKGCTTVRLY